MKTPIIAAAVFALAFVAGRYSAPVPPTVVCPPDQTEVIEELEREVDRLREALAQAAMRKLDQQPYDGPYWCDLHGAFPRRSMDLELHHVGTAPTATRFSIVPRTEAEVR